MMLGTIDPKDVVEWSFDVDEDGFFGIVDHFSETETIVNWVH
jgi:hypothetical protein